MAERNLVGHFCTSLDMVGASITLMKPDDERLGLRDPPCEGFGLPQSFRTMPTGPLAPADR